MKIIHYSRYGYNGDYTYTSACGNRIKTHQEAERCSIYPEETNCDKCKETIVFKSDLQSKQEGIKVRIYLESDILSASEFRGSQREVLLLVKEQGLKCVDRVFSTVLERAWHDLENTWKFVKEADEIYANSSLLPLCGNPSMGAPAIFNGMCDRAIKENITGKSVIILNYLKYVNWDYIDIAKMKKAFKANSLFMYDDSDNSYGNLIKVDIGKIKKR